MERRWPRRKPVVEDVAWDRITRVCWECGEWLCMDNFYLIADHEDREWVVPSGALGHGRLVDVLDRKGIFPTKTYVACQGVAGGRYDLRGECQRQGAEREPLVRRRAEGRFQEASPLGTSIRRIKLTQAIYVAVLAPPRPVSSDVESIVCMRRSRCAADRLHAIEQAPAPSEGAEG